MCDRLTQLLQALSQGTPQNMGNYGRASGGVPVGAPTMPLRSGTGSPVGNVRVQDFSGGMPAQAAAPAPPNTMAFSDVQNPSDYMPYPYESPVEAGATTQGYSPPPVAGYGLGWDTRPTDLQAEPIIVKGLGPPEIPLLTETTDVQGRPISGLSVNFNPAKRYGRQ